MMAVVMIKKNSIKKKAVILILACVFMCGAFIQPVSAAHKHQFYVHMTWKVYDGNKTTIYTHFQCRNCDYGYVVCTGGSRKF